MLALLLIGILIGVVSTSYFKVELETAVLIQVQDAVVLQYEGVNYVVGTVNEEGQQQVSNLEMLSFLISHANDRGIRRAAEAIGFTGPRKVDLEEVSTDEP